ncbi:MAG: hypothetical protein QNL51_14715, partial [Opitutaceae bacterium]
MRRLKSYGVRENDVERALLLVHWMVGRAALSGREGADSKLGWIAMTGAFLNAVIGDEAFQETKTTKYFICRLRQPRSSKPQFLRKNVNN